MISNVSNLNGTLTFRITEVDASIANALRRCILSDIETLVFRDITFTKNTSSFTNEVLKERIACVPIHSRDTKIIGQKVTLHFKNEGAEACFATSDDLYMDGKPANLFNRFKIDEEEFPLELVRLRPSIGLATGEEVEMNCVIGTGTAGESGQFSVASKCSYGMTQDHAASDAAFVSSTESRENWSRLDARRYVVKDSFDFIIQTTGAYTNKDLVQKACEVLIHGLHSLQVVVKPATSTMANCHDVIMLGQDYTLGKAMEYAVLKQEGVAYATFSKPHPHDKDGVLRITADEVDLRVVRAKVHLIHLFTKLSEDFGGVFPKSALEKLEAFKEMDLAGKKAFLAEEYTFDITKMPEEELDGLATALLHGKVKKARATVAQADPEDPNAKPEEPVEPAPEVKVASVPETVERAADSIEPPKELVELVEPVEEKKKKTKKKT
jgi:DNA-directed RNA polymerase alpha subunit